MSQSYKSLIENGGCRIAYVWNVSGYPWGVCTDPTLVSLLSSPETDVDAAYACKRIFGNASIGIPPQFPAYDALIFPTLQNDLGSQTMKSESVGFSEVSAWGIKILDTDLGATWPHVCEDDEVWGLEGLHRVVSMNEFVPDVHAWGFLADNVAIDDTNIRINEQGSGDIFYNRIRDLASHKYVWIGHECIAVDGLVGGETAPIFRASICGRGLFRSKRQYHFVDSVEQVHQIVADVPGSISGHFCWLWAIPLTPDGGFYYDADGYPIIALESDRCGMVSEDIVSESGVTGVKIFSTFDALNTTIDYDVTESIVAHPQKYTFSRGNSGTSWKNIVSLGQRPHLTIWEYTWMARGDTTPFWTATPLWLCEQNSVVVFDTLQDIANAVNAELNQLYLYRSSVGIDGLSQKTGNGALNNERVGTLWQYTISKDYQFYYGDDWPSTGIRAHFQTGRLTSTPMFFLHQLTGSPMDPNHAWLSEDIVYGTTAFPNGWAYGKWSNVSGPIQLVLGLGLPFFDKENPNAQIQGIPISKETYYKIPSILSSQNNSEAFRFSESEILRSFGEGGYVDVFPNVLGKSETACQYCTFDAQFGVPAGLGQRVEVLKFEDENPLPEDYFCATYFVDWNWVDRPYWYYGDVYQKSIASASHWNGTINIIEDIPYEIYTGGLIELAIDPDHEDETICVWINKEQYPEGSPFWCGQYSGVVDDFVVDGEDTFLVNDAVDVHTMTSQDTRSVCVGSALMCVPAWSLKPDEEGKIYNESFDYSTQDPFRIKLKRSQYSDSVVDCVKAFLGYSGTSVTLPYHERKYYLPFFRTDVEDGNVSFIDWDSLTPLIAGVIPYAVPIVPGTSFKLRDAIDASLKLYGIGMYEVWSEYDKQFIWRFRQFGDAISSNAIWSGRVTDENMLQVDSVVEDHILLPHYNKITISYVPLVSDSGKENKIEIVFSDVFAIVDRKSLELKVDLEFETMPVAGVLEAEGSIYNFVSQRSWALMAKKVIQKRLALYSSRFRTTAGYEMILTDPMSRMPGTHELGVEAATAMMIEQEVNLTSNQIDISYIVALPSREVHGYAPACRVAVDDLYNITETYFDCIPEDNYSTQIVKDLFFFDCMDISDPYNPTFRTDSCNDYSVKIFSSDSYLSETNPMSGTCEVQTNGSGLWWLRVYCDTSSLPETGELIITYDTFDNCQTCQKAWLFFSDSLGRVGSDNRGGDVWK